MDYKSAAGKLKRITMVLYICNEISWELHYSVTTF